MLVPVSSKIADFFDLFRVGELESPGHRVIRWVATRKRNTILRKIILPYFGLHKENWGSEISYWESCEVNISVWYFWGFLIILVANSAG